VARRAIGGGTGFVSGAWAAVAEDAGSTGFSAFAGGRADVAGRGVSGAVAVAAGARELSEGVAGAGRPLVLCGGLVTAGGCMPGADPVTSGGAAANEGGGALVTGGGCDCDRESGAAFGAAVAFSRAGSSGFDASAESGGRCAAGTSTGFLGAA
jgi:hypothetical protein